MVYQIYYPIDDARPRRVLFDIEIWLVHNDVDTSTYYTEINADSFVSGCVEYFLDKSKDKNFNWKEFKEDCEALEELRGWLYEWKENKPIEHDAAEERMFEEQDQVRNMVKRFAEKYGLMINED